jgi:hypothetical protein
MKMSDTSRATCSTFASLFESLAGKWTLERNLHSTNANEPSGKCYGHASFTSRTPIPVPLEDGKFDQADAELLYHEQGEFELPNTMRLPFSKKYVWRLNQESSEISVWFVKPTSDSVDYLFHKIAVPHDDAIEVSDKQKEHRQIHGTGGHLCVDDFYNTSYTFTFDANDKQIVAWESLHEVKGPKKDQLIFTKFAKT